MKKPIKNLSEKAILYFCCGELIQSSQQRDTGLYYLRIQDPQCGENLPVQFARDHPLKFQVSYCAE